MEQPGFAAEKRADNDNRQTSTSTSATKVFPKLPRRESLGDRWGNVQVTKSTVFWLCLAAVLLTLLLGFNWGGWMRGSAAQRLAEVTGRDAVTQRLATICVAQFNLDPAKDQKLQELKAASTYKRAEYVTTQGWATMADEEKPTSKVADACAKQLMLLNP
jgi:hypothetical protein